MSLEKLRYKVYTIKFELLQPVDLCSLLHWAYMRLATEKTKQHKDNNQQHILFKQLTRSVLIPLFPSGTGSPYYHHHQHHHKCCYNIAYLERQAPIDKC